MAFISDGTAHIVNLDAVRRIEAQSDGTARFYFDSSDFISLDFGSTQGDAIAGAEKVSQAAPAANYS